MARITGDIVIDRPVEEVFDYVADERNEPSYNPRMLWVKLLTPAPIGVGSRFAAAHRGRRQPVRMQIEFTAYERPRRLASTTTMARGPEVHGVLHFEPVATGTRMRWDWSLSLRGPARLATPVVSALGSRQERACWQGLKRLLESGTEQDGPIPAR
ncbi:SRPBCC family protein [Cumulibacter manganitolerans]|uniref:SRPBCC family protein n=1 Tax=Cumulibacter manganitolerans TaxID=1884992 RepID=UPI001296AC50|nr:SRPBCC family protein [Cumulibacter manganitolerans]